MHLARESLIPVLGALPTVVEDDGDVRLAPLPLGPGLDAGLRRSGGGGRGRGAGRGVGRGDGAGGRNLGDGRVGGSRNGRAAGLGGASETTVVGVDERGRATSMRLKGRGHGALVGDLLALGRGADLFVGSGIKDLEGVEDGAVPSVGLENRCVSYKASGQTKRESAHLIGDADRGNGSLVLGGGKDVDDLGEGRVRASDAGVRAQVVSIRDGVSVASEYDSLGSRLPLGRARVPRVVLTILGSGEAVHRDHDLEAVVFGPLDGLLDVIHRALGVGWGSHKVRCIAR